MDRSDPVLMPPAGIKALCVRHTRKEIAEMHGVTIAKVSEWLRNARKRNKLNDKKVIDILARIDDGLSDSEIASIHNVTAPTIQRIRDGYGWKHIRRGRSK